MIRRWRNTGYYRAAAGTGSDTDALQTDVMRFMSILGLCLMAVFALVQSLPQQEAGPVQQEPERTQLHADIATQRQRAQVLKAELQQLLLLIEQAHEDKAEKERALSDAEQQLTEVVRHTAQAQAEQQRLTGELKSLQQRLERGRYALASLQQAADDKAQSLRELKQHLNLETRELNDIRQKASQVKLKQAEERRRQAIHDRQRQLEKTKQKQAAVRLEEEPRKQAAAKRREREATIQQERQPEKKGFTLRFASDEALQRQVAAGSVSLYAMADKQAWRLSLPHGRPVFTDAAFPGWFHEMAASTVPLEYVRQLKIAVAPKARGTVVWGVQLPPATKRDIASLTRGLQGGELVIASNGRVSLAPE
jgi:small-conductance mechanosensitive channel